MSSITTPAYSWFAPYLNGLNLKFVSSNVIKIAAGSCTNSNTENVINLISDVFVSTLVSGLGGLDTGTIESNTFYAVYVVASSFSPEVQINSESYEENPYPAVGVLSLASNAYPYINYPYNMFRRVGYVLTDSNADIIGFVQTGNSLDRKMMYNEPVTVLVNGSSASFAEVTISSAVPNPNLDVFCLSVFNPTEVGSELVLNPYGSVSNGYQYLVATAAETTVQVLGLPSGSYFDDAAISYKVQGTVGIQISGYVDQL